MSKSTSNSKAGSLSRAYASLKQLKKSRRGGSSNYPTLYTSEYTVTQKIDRLEEQERPAANSQSARPSPTLVTIQGSNQIPVDLLAKDSQQGQPRGKLRTPTPEALQTHQQETNDVSKSTNGVATALSVGGVQHEIAKLDIENLTIDAQSGDTGSNLSKQNKKDLIEHLIDPKKMWEYFSGLVVDAAADAVEEKVEEGAVNFEHSLEVNMAQARSEHRFAIVCNLPLKLILTPLSRGGKFLSAFASLLEIQFGPLHAALQVGDVILEWNDSSLVIPHLCAHEDRIFEADLQHQSSWIEFTSEQYPKIKRAASRMDYDSQIELVYTLAAKKTECIQRLINVIIQYNRLHYYDLILCNCQHFVCDALKALGVEQPNEFRGGLGEYFKALKAGHTESVPGKFKDHNTLDEYIKHVMQSKAIDTMPMDDLEYLLAQYFQFHLKSKSQLKKNSAHWSCPVTGCYMLDLEKRINIESLRIHKFRTLSA